MLTQRQIQCSFSLSASDNCPLLRRVPFLCACPPAVQKSGHQKGELQKHRTQDDTFASDALDIQNNNKDCFNVLAGALSLFIQCSQRSTYYCFQRTVSITKYHFFHRFEAIVVGKNEIFHEHPIRCFFCMRLLTEKFAERHTDKHNYTGYRKRISTLGLQ